MGSWFQVGDLGVNWFQSFGLMRIEGWQYRFYANSDLLFYTCLSCSGTGIGILQYEIQIRESAVRAGGRGVE